MKHHKLLRVLLDNIEQSETTRIQEFRIKPSKRIQCPSCGFSGSLFVSCCLCGGPACNNCTNAAGGHPICFRCFKEKNPEDPRVVRILEFMEKTGMQLDDNGLHLRRDHNDSSAKNHTAQNQDL